MMETTSLLQALETLSYVGLFLWLVLYDLLFFAPLPPYEPLLLTLGYVANMGLFNVFGVIIVIIAAAMLVDNIFFFLSKKGNCSVEKFMSRYKKSTFLKYKQKLEEHYAKSSLVISFIPKIRIFGPVISGTLNVRWRKFFLANALANTSTGMVYALLGFFFHDALQGFMRESSLAEHFLFYLLMLSLAIGVFFLIKKFFLIRATHALKKESIGNDE